MFTSFFFFFTFTFILTRLKFKQKYNVVKYLQSYEPPVADKHIKADPYVLTRY